MAKRDKHETRETNMQFNEKNGTASEAESQRKTTHQTDLDRVGLLRDRRDLFRRFFRRLFLGSQHAAAVLPREPFPAQRRQLLLVRFDALVLLLVILVVVGTGGEGIVAIGAPPVPPPAASAQVSPRHLPTAQREQ